MWPPIGGDEREMSGRNLRDRKRQLQLQDDEQHARCSSCSCPVGSHIQFIKPASLRLMALSFDAWASRSLSPGRSTAMQPAAAAPDFTASRAGFTTSDAHHHHSLLAASSGQYRYQTGTAAAGSEAWHPRELDRSQVAGSTSREQVGCRVAPGLEFLRCHHTSQPLCKRDGGVCARRMLLHP